MRTTGLVVFALVHAGGSGCGIGFRQARLPSHALRRLSSEGCRGEPVHDRQAAVRSQAESNHDLERVCRWMGDLAEVDFVRRRLGRSRWSQRLDTGYVYQRLTRQGVQLLRSRLLATGLFAHNLLLAVGRHHAWVFHQVRRGDRLITVSGVPSPDPSWNQRFTDPTPAQTQALASIEKFVADPANWLPASAWADPRIRAFVPGPLPACFRSVLSRSLEAASSSPQGARPVQAAQEPRVPDRDDGPGAGTRSGVREGWDSSRAGQCRHYRLRPRRPGAPYVSIFLHLHPALPHDRC